MKKLKQYIVYILALSLVVSCQKESLSVQEVLPEQEVVESFRLDLDADVTSETESGGALTDSSTLRQIGLTVQSNGRRIALSLEEKDLSGFVVLKWAGSTDYDIKAVTWKKVKGSNSVSLSDDIPLRNGSGRLFMMGVIGGTYDAKKKAIHFSHNGVLVLPPANGRLNFAIPYATPWVEVEYFPRTGTNRHLRLKAASDAARKLRFKPRAVVLGVGLRNLTPNALIDIHEIKFQSNQLTTNADLKLDAAPSEGNFLQWTFTDPNHTPISRYNYRHAHLGRGGSLPLYYTWAIAQERQTARSPLTRVLVNLTLEGVNQRYRANPTYIKSANNSSVKKVESSYTFTNGKNYLLVPEVRRPKMALEYVADYNIGSTPGVFADTHSNSITEANSTRLYTLEQAKSMTMPRGYIFPDANHMRAIFSEMAHRPGLSFSPVKGIVYADETAESRTTVNAEALAIEDDTRSYRADYYASRYNRSGLRVAYGLRFQGYGNFLLSAWRYRYHETNVVDGGQGGILEVRARYLGASFTGNISTIRDESFWSSNTDDDVVRYFSLNGLVDADGQTKQRRVANSTYYEGYYWSKEGQPTYITHLVSFLDHNPLTPDQQKVMKMAIRPFLIE